MRAQLDPRSDWVQCTSAAENPQLLLKLKEQHIHDRNLSIIDQESLLQDCVDEALTNGVLITRLRAMPQALGVAPKDLEREWKPNPALKVCVTITIGHLCLEYTSSCQYAMPPSSQGGLSIVYLVTVHSLDSFLYENSCLLA